MYDVWVLPLTHCIWSRYIGKPEGKPPAFRLPAPSKSISLAAESSKVCHACCGMNICTRNTDRRKGTNGIESIEFCKGSNRSTMFYKQSVSQIEATELKLMASTVAFFRTLRLSGLGPGSCHSHEDKIYLHLSIYLLWKCRLEPTWQASKICTATKIMEGTQIIPRVWAASLWISGHGNTCAVPLSICIDMHRLYIDYI